MYKKLSSLFLLASALIPLSPVLAQQYVVSPAPTAYCPQLSYNHYLGLSDRYTGGQVTALQQYLASRGMYQPVTGYFGSMTRANVAILQQQLAVYPITGGVGPLTRAAIVRTCGNTTPPTQGLSAYPASGYAPLTVTFTPNSTPGGYYAIQFGDGQSLYMLQGPVTHTYTNPGTYTASATSDLACLHTQPQCYTFAAQQNLGSATITVSQGQAVGGLTVTSPSAGQVVPHGSTLPISWGYPVTPGSATMVIDLYTAAGSKVGTMAISNQTSGTYNWSVPPFPNNLMCTMQYPNGLCGVYLSGQYYVQVSATSGSGFDNTSAIATGRSGTFTIQ